MQHPPVSEGDEFLSHEDERAVLATALIQRLPQHGGLFEPTQLFYDQLQTEAGIETAIRDLYRWLGSKPRRIEVIITDEGTLSQHDHTFTIPDALLTSPYQLAASLTILVIDQLLTQRLHTQISESLTETASLEAGFGLVILNGIAEKTTKSQPLTTYSPTSYAQAFAEYCHQTKQDGQAVMAQLSKQAGKLMPAYYQQSTVIGRTAPGVIQNLHTQHTRTLMKIAGTAGVIGLLCGTALFILSQRPYTPTQAIRSQYEKTQQLAQTHADCTSKTQKLQNAYNQDDIFRERQINAALTECQSLRNQYNYEVNIYNALVNQ